MATEGNGPVTLPDFITVRDLAELINASPIDVIKRLMNDGIIANINQQIDFDTAAIVCEEFGVEVQSQADIEAEARAAEEAAPSPLWERFYAQEDPTKLIPRPPVVTMLGHVDHGKTSLLDAIRGTNVFAGEAGGITQNMSAYQIQHAGRTITFLDTPGHEAFTAMRARGAQGADIAILVVAADDGVMPQTREAISHARAAKTPIIVALNKMDLASAAPDRAKQELADLDLTPDEWGGNTLVVPVSAKKKTGLDDLLEALLLVADEAEIVANPDREAQGTVIEGSIDKSRGIAATLLVQNGVLCVGDAVVVGEACGRIRAMFDFRGKRVQQALPSTPVTVLGLSTVPVPGDVFEVVEDEKCARAIVAERESERAQQATRRTPPSLEQIMARFQEGKTKTLNLIIKADVHGTLHPITESLRKLESDELKIDILHADTGDVIESDVMLASVSQAIIIGFQVSVDPAARRMADSEGVDIRLYDIIYNLVDDVDKALQGLLPPTIVKMFVGEAEVRDTFKISGVGTVAGCYIKRGEARRNAKARLLRGDSLLFDGSVASLKRFQEDVREVRAGFECGVGLGGFDDIQAGDNIEFYIEEEKR